MAAAAELLGGLLRLAVSSPEEEELYICAASLVLERLGRERDEGTASEALLAGLLGQLHGELEEPAKSHSGSQRGGGGEGEGPERWEKGAGERWESVWQLCRQLAPLGERGLKTLLSFVCGCRHFQVVCCQLMASALAAGRACGFWRRELERRFLRHIFGQFISERIDRFAKRVDPYSDGVPQTDWVRCLEQLTLLLTICEMSQNFTQPLTCKEDFLCRSTTNKLAVKLSQTFPRALHIAYQQWWSSDEKSLKISLAIPPIHRDRAGQILKSGHSLGSSLLLFGSILAPWNGMGTVLESCLETVLRLANLHLKNISKVVQLVPDQISVRLRYILINSAVCLHSTLTRLKSILKPTGKYESLFSGLLQEVTEFTDTLTTHTVTHHTHLIRFSILQDPDAGNWFHPRPYHEGERCSLPLQMWHYHLCGLRGDLWEVGGEGGGEVMVRILREVLCNSVSFLEHRFSRASPSFERTRQLRADILMVLAVVEYFRPHVTSPPPSPSSSLLPSLSTSCLSLLCTVAVVTSPLEALSASLEATPTLPPSYLHHSHWKWLEFIDLSPYGLPATSNQNTDDTVQIFWNFISLPYPSWHILIKLFLAKRGRSLLSLLVSMVMYKRAEGEEPMETRNTDLILRHVFQVLSHCVCEPHVLLDTLSLLTPGRRSAEDASFGTSFQMVCSSEWPRHLVKDPVQRCIGRWVLETAQGTWEREGTSLAGGNDGECGFVSMPTDGSGVAMVADHILRLLDALESALSELPSPVTFALSRLAGGTRGGSGAAIAKMVASILSDWLYSPPLSSLPPSLHPHLSLSLSLVSWTLTGASTNLTSFPPHVSEALKKGLPLIRRRLESFGSSLSGSSPDSIPEPDYVELGYEVVAEMLENHPEAQDSLYYIYHWLQARKEYVVKMLQLPGNAQSEPVPPPPPNTSSLTPPKVDFNPLEVGVSLSNWRIDHQQLLEPSLSWEGLLAFTLPQLTPVKLVKLVGNRFEFQPDTQLLDNEPDLVQKINKILHQTPPQQD